MIQFKFKKIQYMKIINFLIIFLTQLKSERLGF